jgi:RES domain-containing protein
MNDAMQHRVEAWLKQTSSAPFSLPDAVRVVPAFPPIDPLEQLDPALQAVALAEAASVSPDILGNLDLLPAGPLPAGPGASRIITSFTFSKPNRFNDETFGAFYAGESLQTAIKETVHHILQELMDSGAPAQTLPTRAVLLTAVSANAVTDVRAVRYDQIYDPDDYTESRMFGASVRNRGDQGIAYRSVRCAGGECVAIFDQSALSNCREDRKLVYRYAAGKIDVSEPHYSSGP